MGVIEAGIRPINSANQRFIISRLFNIDREELSEKLDEAHLSLSNSGNTSFPTITISIASDHYLILAAKSFPNLTLKISNCNISQHDQAFHILQKISDSLFFQIDLMLELPLALAPSPDRMPISKRRVKFNTLKDLQYPQSEYDTGPMSLYRYARSASGMPLLQFLAFYQAIEFYFPAYAEAEAHRKIQSILKDPGFRYDRDTDIASLLNSITISKSG